MQAYSKLKQHEAAMATKKKNPLPDAYAQWLHRSSLPEEMLPWLLLSGTMDVRPQKWETATG